MQPPRVDIEATEPEEMLQTSRARLSPLLCRLFHTVSYLCAGHSKWQNIRHDKAKNDAKKSKDANTLATRITASVKQGGVAGNSQLATLLEKARKMSIQKKIIDNAVKRGTGELKNEGEQTHDVSYEFMGQGGIAMIVEATTDNKTRTVSYVKHALSKIKATLSPCQYLFQKKGEIIFEPISSEEQIDDVLDTAIEVGADDVEEYIDSEQEYDGERLFRVITQPNNLHSVSNNLTEKGYKLHDSKHTFIADLANQVDFPEEHAKGMKKCIDALDEITEVTNYYTNIRD